MIRKLLPGGGVHSAVKMLLVVLCVTLSFETMKAQSPKGQSPSGATSDELEIALKKIDESAASFRNFRAGFSQKKYTAILQEFDVPESGDFYYAFDKNGSVLMRHEVSSPGSRILTIKGDAAVIYQPRIKQAQIASLGKRKNLLEYLGTGFGQSSARLRQRYNLSYGGSESVNGTPCHVIVFHPKDPAVSASLESITVWFAKKTGIPAQYKLLEPNRDYLLLTFFDEQLNGKVADSTFEQRLPAGVEIMRIN